MKLRRVRLVAGVFEAPRLGVEPTHMLSTERSDSKLELELVQIKGASYVQVSLSGARVGLIPAEQCILYPEE